MLTENEFEYLFDRIDADGNDVLSDGELSSFDDSCLPCPKHGAVCNTKGVAIPDMEVGYWRTYPMHPDVNKFKYYKCMRRHACPGGNGSVTCAVGYHPDSAACSYCSLNYVLENNQCSLCEGKETIGFWLQVTVLAVGFLVLTSVFFCVLTQPSLSEKDLDNIRGSFRNQTSLMDLGEHITPEKRKLNEKKRSSVNLKDVHEHSRTISFYDNDEIEHIISLIDLDKNKKITRREIEMFVGETEDITVVVNDLVGVKAELVDGGMLVQDTENSQILCGDIIHSVNGKKIKSDEHYETMVNLLPEGASLGITRAKSQIGDISDEDSDSVVESYEPVPAQTGVRSGYHSFQSALVSILRNSAKPDETKLVEQKLRQYLENHNGYSSDASFQTNWERYRDFLRYQSTRLKASGDDAVTSAAILLKRMLDASLNN
eukprot:Stramenopile-MAST_4_protein_5007